MKALIVLLAVFLSASTLAATADPAKGQAIVAKTCGGCHGLDGNSVVPSFPRLAGQHAAYIVKQLNAFKSGARVNVTMSPQAKPLSDADVQDVAAYFAAQTPKVDTASDEASLERGRILYRGGDKERALPACMACHGPSGAGVPTQFPRIGGQHVDYLIAQLKAYQDGSRGGDGKDASAAIMHTVALKLSAAEINDLAQYLTSLHLK